MNQAFLTPLSWRPRPMDTCTQPELRVPTPTSLSPVERDAGQLHLEEAREAFMRGQMVIIGKAPQQTPTPSPDMATQNFVLNFLLREQEVKIQGLEGKLVQQSGWVGNADLIEMKTSQATAADTSDNVRSASAQQTTPRPFLLPPIEFVQNKQKESPNSSTSDNAGSQAFAAQLNTMPFSTAEFEQRKSVITSKISGFRALPLTPASRGLCRYPRVRSQRVEKKRKPVESIHGVSARSGLRGFVNWNGERVVPPKGAGSVLI
ncbi:hypothetical protein LTR95_001697 [Oleoguttula sp. CCFEE 5521]